MGNHRLWPPQRNWETLTPAAWLSLAITLVFGLAVGLLLGVNVLA